MRYFRHKEKPEVTCELLDDTLRFGKWSWTGLLGERECKESYSYKELTKEFFNSFEEMTQKEFNDDWGTKLEKA